MRNRKKVFSEVILCSIGLMVFSFFIHYNQPLKLISFAALVFSGFIIGMNMKSRTDILRITGDRPSFRYLIFLLAAGTVSAFLFVILYRWHLGVSLIPSFLREFALIAALIGITEEIVFRGYVQGRLRDINSAVSILAGTLAHTGYKCCLFISPVVAGSVDIGFLALWTIIAGIIMGIINHFTRSLIPSLVAHGLFDILVYAEAVSPPWWVW